MKSWQPFMQILLAGVFCLLIIDGNIFTGVCSAQSQAAEGAEEVKVDVEELGRKPFEPLYVYVPAAKLRKAIESYKKAFDGYDKKKYPREYGILQNRIGFSYLVLQTPKRGDDVYKAASHFGVAIKVCGEKGFAKEYYEAKIGMGLALIELTEGYHAKNLQEAIEMLREGAKFFTKEGTPLANAIANDGLGSVHLALYALSDRNKEELVTAEGYFNKVLSIASREKFPVEYAKAQIGLGNVYLDLRSTGGDKILLEKGLNALSEARSVFSEEFFPTLYTRTFFLAGLAYTEEKDFEKADEFLEQTMEIAGRTKDPRFQSYMDFYYVLEASRGLIK